MSAANSPAPLANEKNAALITRLLIRLPDKYPVILSYLM